MSFKFRTQAYETIGGIFRDMKQDYIEFKLNKRIMAAIIRLFIILDELGIIFDVELVISKLITYDSYQEINSVKEKVAPL